MTRVIYINGQDDISLHSIAGDPGQVLAQLRAGGVELHLPFQVVYLEGMMVITPLIAAPSGQHQLAPHITPREKAVIQGLAGGGTAKSIAYHLGIQPSTVHGYIRAVKVKFHAQTREQLIARAVALGVCTVHAVNRVLSDATT